MTPEEVGTRFGGAASVSAGGDFARVTVDVPPDDWATAAARARADGYDFFDWLSAVDELDAGFSVVAHVLAVAAKRGPLVRAAVPREAPAPPTTLDIHPGTARYP